MQKSYTEQTEEELDKIAIESSEDSMEEEPPKVPAYHKRMMIAAGAIAVAMLCLVLSKTACGTWLANECMVISTLIQKVSALASGVMDKIPWPAPEHGAESIWQTITILFASVLVCPDHLPSPAAPLPVQPRRSRVVALLVTTLAVCSPTDSRVIAQAVPAVLKFIPGGSAILGFLIAGAAIGPFGMGFILDTEPVKHLAEIGVIFLLFNLGLELSLERLIALAKQVFVLGTLQFTLSTLAIAGVATLFAGYSGPAAIIVGGALALSSTAVVMKIMQERSETGSRHGRATFAILLFQDLAVVVLLMLVPLLATGGSGGHSPSPFALPIQPRTWETGLHDSRAMTLEHCCRHTCSVSSSTDCIEYVSACSCFSPGSEGLALV